ncbi:MAG: molybdenum cofactor guanylyltransferase, partial [Aquihabitans sp.]
VRRALFDGGVGAVVLGGGDADDEGAVPDRWPGEGPLAGLATAVAAGAASEGVAIVVVAACDQPDLPAELVADLVHALAAGPAEAAASAVRSPDGRLHPFPSAWRTSVAGDLGRRVEAGERRADAAFALGHVIEVAGDPGLLHDLDTPDDVRRWLDRPHGA